MSRLTKEQIRQYRMTFEQWQSPRELLSRCEDLMSRMSGETLFSQSGLGFIREGWAAATFGALRSAKTVRTVPERESWPDFEMCLQAKVEQWELTEADVPGRRRGDEYRNDPLVPGDRALGLDWPENYIARIDSAPSALRSSCEAKAAKNYSSRAALLIYLNISDFGARHEETIKIFPDATLSAKDSFSEVWVLWKNQCYPIWKNGSQYA